MVQTFKYQLKKGQAKVAGCNVSAGKLDATKPFMLLRDGEIIHEGKVALVYKFLISFFF